MINYLDRIKCAASWLDRSIKLHKIHMDDPTTATQESQEELNKQIINARKCLLR